jgi:hypothetical protein
LLEYLRRDDGAQEISLEVLDDIAIEGEQTELLQVKLQIEPGSLTDGSTGIWKTLRVWSASAASAPDTLLILVTTATAPEGSIASLLRPVDRDPRRAHERLVEYAKATTTKTLAPARKVFLELEDAVRLAMVERIVITDGAPGIADLDAEFERAVRHAAAANRRKAFAERLREWWLRRTEVHLLEVAEGVDTRIAGAEIEDQMTSLREQLTRENLPNDYEEMAAPSDEEVTEDKRAFVMQLRLIALSNERIRVAIHDHNRAFEQRSRWLREDLLIGDELGVYETRLKDEWQRLWLPETDGELDQLTDGEAQDRGRAVYSGCSGAVLEPIRPKVSAPYIQRGSFHILAEDRKIGWHHEWVDRVAKLLEEASS